MVVEIIEFRPRGAIVNQEAYLLLQLPRDEMESVDSNLILGDMGENLSISSSAFKEVFAIARQGRH